MTQFKDERVLALVPNAAKLRRLRFMVQLHIMPELAILVSDPDHHWVRLKYRIVSVEEIGSFGEWALYGHLKQAETREGGILLKTVMWQRPAADRIDIVPGRQSRVTFHPANAQG